MPARMDVVVAGCEVKMVAVAHDAARVEIEMRRVVPIRVARPTPPSPAKGADIG